MSHLVLGLSVFKYDEIMILFYKYKEFFEDEYRTAQLQKQH